MNRPILNYPREPARTVAIFRKEDIFISHPVYYNALTKAQSDGEKKNRICVYKMNNPQHIACNTYPHLYSKLFC